MDAATPTMTRLTELRDQWTAFARSEPLGTALVWFALGCCTLASSIVLLFPQSLTPTERATLIIAGLVSWALLIALGWARGTLPTKAVVGAIAVTLGLAVATPSYQSKDIYSYAMYGRIVTVHHQNPYDNYPMHFEGDPMRRHVSEVWQRTPDIYGPAFTTVMAALAPVIGESTLLARLLYQLIALAAVGALLWVLWRRTRSPTVLAFVGLHPLVAVSVVNGGHPDALIALAFLLAVLLALERRVVLCAWALVLGVAINFSVIVAAVALGVWGYRRWSRSELAKFSTIVLCAGALPYLFLSGWLQNAHEHQQLISRQSIWNPLATVLTSSGPLSSISLTTQELRSVVPNATTLIAGVLLVVVLVRFTGQRTPAIAMAAALAVFLVTSPWVMPWYAFAAFPLLALARPSLLAWAVAAYSALILVGDQFPSLSAKAIGSVPHSLLEILVPIIACIACVAAIVARPREPARPATDENLVTAAA